MVYVTAFHRSAMKATSIPQLIAAAPSGVPLHMVVDSSAIPNFVHMADAFRCQRICLFDGKPGEELSDVAPHLVAIDGKDPDCHDYLWDCIAGGNAIVVGTGLPQLRLKTYLKRFLRRKMNGKEYYVKFYTANNFLYLLDAAAGFSKFFENVQVAMVADVGPGRTMQSVTKSEVASHG